MQRALVAAAPAQRKHDKKEFERGKKDGYAWAESGRSIAAVEAVVKFAIRPSLCAAAEVVTNEMIVADGELEADLLDKMVEEIGDDEEFEALQDKDDAYIDGWYARRSRRPRSDVTRCLPLLAVAAGPKRAWPFQQREALVIGPQPRCRRLRWGWCHRGLRWRAGRRPDPTDQQNRRAPAWPGGDRGLPAFMPFRTQASEVKIGTIIAWTPALLYLN